jgi:hypothetical protein
MNWLGSLKLNDYELKRTDEGALISGHAFLVDDHRDLDCLQPQVTSMAQRDMIRNMAFLSLGLAGFLLLLALLNLRSWSLYGEYKWWPPLLLGAAYWGVLGIGMLYFRKWAALLFALSTTGFGLLLVIAAISAFVKHSFPGVLINIPLGLSLGLPMIPVVRSWRELK